LNERDSFVSDQDLIQFYEKYKKRDLIIYDLTNVHIDQLIKFLMHFNDHGFNSIDDDNDIQGSLVNYLNANSF